jgi:hypothetical protein
MRPQPTTHALTTDEALFDLLVQDTEGRKLPLLGLGFYLAGAGAMLAGCGALHMLFA